MSKVSLKESTKNRSKQFNEPEIKIKNNSKRLSMNKSSFYLKNQDKCILMNKNRRVNEFIFGL